MIIKLDGDNYDVRFRRGRYSNGAVAIQAVDNLSGEVVCTVTTNLHEAFPSEGCVFVKDYSENGGLADQLEDAGLIKPTGRWEPSGWVQIQEYRLTGEWSE